MIAFFQMSSSARSNDARKCVSFFAAARLVRAAAQGDWGRSPQVLLRGGARPHACKTKKTTTINKTNHTTHKNTQNQNPQNTQKNISI